MEGPESGQRIVAILGVPAATELLEVLNRPEEERAHLIGRLLARDDTTEFAETLIEVESDPDDITRLRLIDARNVHRTLGRPGVPHPRSPET
jgi:hypothetical protein